MKSQKPVPALIHMRVKDPDFDGMEFVQLLADLLREGLILEQPREVRRHAKELECYELICTFADQAAARCWNTWPAIQECYQRDIKPFLHGKPKLIRQRDAIFDYDNEESCACDPWSTLVLAPNPFGSQSAVVCAACRNPIPRYRLPQDLDLAEWANLYRYIYMVWLAGGALEMWAEGQLREFDSDLNRDARQIMTGLRKSLNLPVYYLIWTKQDSPTMACPNCNGKGQDSTWERPLRICKRCRLGFGY